MSALTDTRFLKVGSRLIAWDAIQSAEFFPKRVTGHAALEKLFLELNLPEAGDRHLLFVGDEALWVWETLCRDSYA